MYKQVLTTEDCNNVNLYTVTVLHQTQSGGKKREIKTSEMGISRETEAAP